MGLEGHEFHLTIGATPTEGVDLSQDLRLVKAAILYGDKIKLCSAMSSVMHVMHGFDRIKFGQQIDLMAALLPSIIKDQHELQQMKMLVALCRRLVSKKHKSAHENQLMSQMRKELAELWERTIQQHSAFTQPEAVKGIEKAINEGILELYAFKKFDDTSEMIKNVVNDALADRETVRELMFEYLDLITEAVQNGETYPMFDDETGRMLRAFAEVGSMVASPASIAQSKQSALAADLLKRLPLFDEATVHEVIDIRRELDRPLLRFRSAVMGYAEKMKSASWDEDFSIEAEQVFRRDLEPAVLEIEDMVNSNASLHALAIRKIADKNVLLTSLFSFVVSNFTNLPKITQLMWRQGSAGPQRSRKRLMSGRSRLSGSRRTNSTFTTAPGLRWRKGNLPIGCRPCG